MKTVSAKLMIIRHVPSDRDFLLSIHHHEIGSFIDVICAVHLTKMLIRYPEQQRDTTLSLEP